MRIFTDYRGYMYDKESAAAEANKTIIKGAIDKIADGVVHEVSNIYLASEHVSTINEACGAWHSNISSWCRDNFNSDFRTWYGDQHINDMVYNVIDKIKRDILWEPIYSLKKYEGDGCCLTSFEVGEVEEEVDILSHKALSVAWKRGELNTALDQYSGIARIGDNYCYDRRTDKCVKNGHIYNNPRPVFYIYLMFDAWWHFVVPEADMWRLLAKELLSDPY